MKKQRKIILPLVIFLAVVALVFWSRKQAGEPPQLPQPLPSPPVLPTVPKTSASLGPMQALMKTPILFYGIVLDQRGTPIPGAKVNASVLDNMIGGSPLSTTADATGKFTIQSKGRSLHIEVSSVGLSRVERGGKLKPSSQGFDYGVDDGKGIHRANPASPVVFQLRNPQNPVSLETLNANPGVPRDGSPINVILSKSSKSVLQIRCRTVEDNEVPNAPYDWRCEVSVEGGGIQETEDEDAFEAPADGYTPYTVIDMPKTLDVKKWNSRVSKIYWLRFPDNTFAKIGFRMNARGEHFAVINGFRNPSPDDRNLEPKLESR